MNILDIFSFKKQATKLFSKENIDEVFTLARGVIVDLVQRNMPGPDKKEALDQIITGKIETIACDYNNGILKWLVGQLIKIMPQITQFIYDYLKERVDGLTK